MQTSTRTHRGFTLVELLTVIAIIGILAGLTLAGVTRYMQSARMGKLTATFSNLNTLLTDYYTENGTYPPAYGYVLIDARDEILECGTPGDPSDDATPREDPSCLQFETGNPDVYSLVSYLDYLGQRNNFELYDPFSQRTGHDTNFDNYLDDLEYSPLRVNNDAAFSHSFESDDLGTLLELYDNTDLASRASAFKQTMLQTSPRPILYFPVNKRQAERVAQEWFQYADDIGNNDDNLWNDNPRPENGFDVLNDDSVLELLSEGRPLGDVDDAGDAEFPPAKYDAFVLMSMGPAGNTFGFLRELPQMIDFVDGAYAPELRYHIFGMLVYIMASRDANQNGKLDFDYNARKGGEGQVTYFDGVQEAFANGFFMSPNPNNEVLHVEHGLGPAIYVSN